MSIRSIFIEYNIAFITKDVATVVTSYELSFCDADENFTELISFT